MHVISIPGQQAEVLLSCRGLQRAVDKHQLWRDLDFDVCRGDVLFVRGPSGVGKTLLLRTLACLDPVEGGYMRLLGKTPSEVGIPCWRAQVMYVHQQRVSYPGTPLQLFERVQGFASQKARGPNGPGTAGFLAELVDEMGLEQGVLNQQWSQLSGGQAQRVSLAISIALRPQVLLVDEPTSACDSDATRKVEAVLRKAASTTAVVWVTHDDDQPQRVGGRVMMLPAGTLSTIGQPAEQQQADGSSSSDSSSTAHQQPPAGDVDSNISSSVAAGVAQAPPPQAAWREEAAVKA